MAAERGPSLQTRQFRRVPKRQAPKALFLGIVDVSHSEQLLFRFYVPLSFFQPDME